MNEERVEFLVRELLDALEVRLGNAEKDATAGRVTRLWADLLAGESIDAYQVLNGGFPAGHQEIVALANIPFYSLCEHHLLPFYGSVGVVYIPGAKGYVAGASKLGEVVEMISRRLQIQERFTTQIAQAVDKGLLAKGVYVVVRAEHLCITMKDRKNLGTKLVTLGSTGVFRSDERLVEQAQRLLEYSDKRGDTTWQQDKES